MASLTQGTWVWVNPGSLWWTGRPGMPQSTGPQSVGWATELNWTDAVWCLVSQSCPILCDPMDCSLPGFCVHGDSPDKKTGGGCSFLLQGIVQTPELNRDLLHHRWILYQRSYQGSPCGRLVFKELTVQITEPNP